MLEILSQVYYSIETCILSYVKQIASPGSMHETGRSGRCTGMTLRDGKHMYTHGWFMSMYGKNHYNIVISLQLKVIN